MVGYNFMLKLKIHMLQNVNQSSKLQRFDVCNPFEEANVETC